MKSPSSWRHIGDLLGAMTIQGRRLAPLIVRGVGSSQTTRNEHKNSFLFLQPPRVTSGSSRLRSRD